MTNIEKFLHLLNSASAITVDDGPLLTGINAEELTGDPDNQLVCFTWTDGEHDYMDILTEGGIASGEFDSDGKFVADNYEGEKTAIRFFTIEPLNDSSGKQAADLFFLELLNSVETLTGIAETLTGIAETHGARTLVDLMFLQNVILSGGFIEHCPVDSNVMEIASALPSGERWSKFIREENQASP